MLRRPNLPQAVEDALLSRISSRAYQDGDKLPSEHELAESLGVSRTSIREALNRLQRLGLIRTVRGSKGGSFVQRLDMSVVTEALTLLLRMNGVSFATLMEARRAMAPSIAALAAEHATDADIGALEALCTTVADGLKADRFESGAIVAFHLKLAEMTQNSFLDAIARPLTEIASVYFQRLWRVEVRARLPAILAMHRGVVAAIKAHDADLARSRMIELMDEAAVGLHDAD
jgi:GntR family transcriptional repressor for pyruvate dehydrogenase complex